MATLYEINEAILACIDEETGEILDGERLNELQMERSDKIESVALWYKDLTAEIKAFKAEKNAFAERQKKAEAKAESIKKWLADALNGERFETAKALVSFRKSQKIEIDNIYDVDENFLRYSEPTADKNAIKDAIKAGEAVKGARLVDALSISVK